MILSRCASSRRCWVLARWITALTALTTLTTAFSARAASTSRPDAAGRPTATRHHAATHWVLRIPRIGVDAPVFPLGARRRQVMVPSLTQSADVAWYRFSAIPGQAGNAVLLGHVDTYTGPAVFYDLYLLRPGDVVILDHERFDVRWVKEVPKTRFPVRAVFGPAATATLWLVTCGGGFDYRTRSYESNIIVKTTPERMRS